MKKINIFWFSGTGNSLLLTKEIAGNLRNRGHEVNLFPIEKTNPEKIVVDSDTIIGIITTVAMQGTYRLVWEFIKKLPNSNGNSVFFADSLAGYSGGLLGPVKKIIERKGYKALVAKEFIMPLNFNRKAKASSADRDIITKSKEKVNVFCEEITLEKKTWKDIPVYSDLMASISKSKFIENMLRKLMPVNIKEDKCIECGLCVKLCPVGNLKGDGVPVAENKCILCHRCVGFCPKNAIVMGKKQTIPYKAVETKEMLNELDK